MFVARISGGATGKIRGRIVHAGIDRDYGSATDPVILVIPHGGVEYYTTVVSSARLCGRVGVVMASGGATCHLAINVNEKAGSVALMLLPDALSKLPDGAMATLDPLTCSIELEREE